MDLYFKFWRMMYNCLFPKPISNMSDKEWDKLADLLDGTRKI